DRHQPRLGGGRANAVAESPRGEDPLLRIARNEAEAADVHCADGLHVLPAAGAADGPDVRELIEALRPRRCRAESQCAGYRHCRQKVGPLIHDWFSCCCSKRSMQTLRGTSAKAFIPSSVRSAAPPACTSQVQYPGEAWTTAWT